MNTSIFFLILLGAAALVMFAMWQKSRQMQQALAELRKEQSDVKAKLDVARKELSSTKEDLSRKTRSLDEAREQSKKKLRKEAQKSEFGEEIAEKSEDAEKERLQKNLRALEMQLGMTKKELDKSRSEIEQALEHQHRSEIARLTSELSSLKTELEHEKKPARVKGLRIDLEALPKEAVGELARLHRKAEQHEKLHGIAEGKVRMSQERFAELQKKYFAVCRELALAVGTTEVTTDEAARDVAEDILAKADKAHEEAQS